MTIRIPFVIAAVAAFGLAACNPAERQDVRTDADQAAAETGDAAAEAGSALKEEAGQVGDAIQAGASEAAQEVDEATDALQRKADEQKAETAADHTGNTAAPATN
jgi:hypothetical protein